MPQFKVVSEYTPSGDQPQAIEKLAEGLENIVRAAIQRKCFRGWKLVNHQILRNI